MMGIFEKQELLFEGSNRLVFQGYQEILRNNGIRFKAYVTDDRVAGGCCGLNSARPIGASQPRCTYSLFVRARELEAARSLVAAHQPGVLEADT